MILRILGIALAIVLVLVGFYGFLVAREYIGSTDPEAPLDLIGWMAAGVAFVCLISTMAFLWKLVLRR